MMEYQHGGDIYSREILWDFSANINPLGPPESVKNAVRQSAEYCAAYPDSECRKLVHALSVHYHCPEEDILCGNGAADLIYQIAAAVHPAYALVPVPAFTEYEQALTAAGSRIIRHCSFREDSFAVHTDALIRKILIHERENGTPPALIILCNPNNPTGLVIKQKDLIRLAGFAEEQKITLLLDECFVDFLDSPEDASMLNFRSEFPRLIILKAFTKLYGMAGLRLGCCLTGNHSLLEQIRKIRQPWSISTTAQMAGLAALSEKEYVKKTRKIIAQGREQLFQGLQDLGFQVWPGTANYLFFRDMRTGAGSGILYRSCLEKKLLLRSCGNYPGLDGSYYRICIKTKEENEHLLAMLREELHQ